MGATSVTGVGHGSSEGSGKGAGNGRNLFVPLQTPHVVAAGTVSLSGGTATITFPTPLTGSKTGYVVIVQPLTSSTTYVSTMTNNSDVNFSSFVITGTGTDSVMWSVMTDGWA